MRFLATAIVALALLSPTAALAQDSNPFDGQLPPAQPTPAPTVEPVEDSSDGDVGRTTLFVIGGGLLVFFVGIGFWISRDARSNLTADERDDVDRFREGGPAHQHKHAREAKAKAREKTRAQKQARKAHRKKAQTLGRRLAPVPPQALLGGLDHGLEHLHAGEALGVAPPRASTAPTRCRCARACPRSPRCTRRACRGCASPRR